MVFFIALLVQFSFLPMIIDKTIIPNLILIIAVIAGTKKSSLESFCWFLLAGFIYEMFSVEVFGFSLLIFSLVGAVVWLLKNIFLNKEKNIFLEIFFWFLVKILWDFIYKIIFIMFEVFQRKERAMHLFSFSENYFQEILIFVLSGFFITVIWNFIKSRFSTVSN